VSFRARFSLSFSSMERILRLFSMELLLVTELDELWKRQFPRFLAVIRNLAKVLRVHAKLTGHLHLSMREMKPFTGFDPRLELIGNESCFRHNSNLLRCA